VSPVNGKAVALVPAWKAEAFIRETLDSLVAQTYRNLEVLIAVDQCADDTVAICREYEARHPNFRVHAHETRQGWVGNSNWLLNAAQGDYLLFAFHDDILGPDYISACVAALEADGKAVIAYTDVECSYQTGPSEHRVYTEMDGLSCPVARARKMIWQIGYWSVPNRGVFRARAAKAIGGLKRHAAGEFSSDWAWLTAMSLQGGFVRVPGVMVWKHYKRDSLSRSWKFRLADWLKVSSLALREIRAAPITAGQKLQLTAAIWGVRRHWLKTGLSLLLDRRAKQAFASGIRAGERA
jgi:glycosyltransferase involved in cell wall biosynthesis